MGLNIDVRPALHIAKDVFIPLGRWEQLQGEPERNGRHFEMVMYRIDPETEELRKQCEDLCIISRISISGDALVVYADFLMNYDSLENPSYTPNRERLRGNKVDTFLRKISGSDGKQYRRTE